MSAVGNRPASPLGAATEKFVWSDFLVGLTVLIGGLTAGAVALQFLFG